MSDRLLQLTLEQKLYVAQREVTETRQDQEKLKQRYERIQDNYKVTAHSCTKNKQKKNQSRKHTVIFLLSDFFCLSRLP